MRSWVCYLAHFSCCCRQSSQQMFCVQADKFIETSVCFVSEKKKMATLTLVLNTEWSQLRRFAYLVNKRVMWCNKILLIIHKAVYAASLIPFCSNFTTITMHLLHSLCLTLLVIKVTVEKNQTHAFTAGKYTFIINYTQHVVPNSLWVTC